MSDRIGKPPPSAGDPLRNPPAAGKPAGVAPKDAGPARTPEPGEGTRVDQFERQAGGPLPKVLEQRLQSAGARTNLAQMLPKNLAALGSELAIIMQQFPNADRTLRARKFTRAILKHRGLKKMFLGMSEAEMDRMSDIIGDFVQGSPLFGQLVDDVADGASK